MKIARYIAQNGKPALAVKQADGSFYKCLGQNIFEPENLEATSEKVEIRQFLPPVDPRAIICVAASYRKHIEESNLKEQPDPVIFMKNPASATGHNCPVVLPAVCDDEVDYEGELAVFLSKDCCNVTRQQAAGCISGYTVANDISARIWQLERGGGQWVRGKSFDTFTPLGPCLVTPDEIGSTEDLEIKTVLDGRVVQKSSTKNMIRSIPELISFLSQATTLLAGTVILTGTPEGVGWFTDPRLLLRPGSTVSVEIEKIGILSNTVEAEKYTL